MLTVKKKIFFIVLLVFFILVQGEDPETNSGTDKLRIVAGREVTDRTLFPYVVALRYYISDTVYVPFCGGSIINKRHVLTAAHCRLLHGVPIPLCKTYILAGILSPLEQETAFRVVAKYFFVHEDYNPLRTGNDIAIIRTCEPFPESSPTISSIEIASKPFEAGTRCTAVGWGQFGSKTSPKNSYIRTLHYVEIPIRRNQVCREKYNEGFTNKMICAGIYGKGTCKGDSGGPLTCQGVVAGITSFGYVGDCNEVSVYTEVRAYKDWIAEQLKRSSANSLAFHDISSLQSPLSLVSFFYLLLKL